MPEFQLDIERSGSQGSPEVPAEASDGGREEGKRIRRKDILNLINFIHFREGTIFAQFRHLKYDERVSVRARPKPCVDETFECSWVPHDFSPERLRNYAFDGILLSDGQELFRVAAEIAKLEERTVVFKLPDFGHEKSGRKMRRHECVGISARLIQNGVGLSGTLADFSSVSCRVALAEEARRDVRWINSGGPVLLTLEKDGLMLFSGECSVTRSDGAADRGELVLSPIFDNVRRYRPREIRSQRHKLVPVPNVHFEHPLTRKRLFLQATDLSGAGFATEEFFHSSTLLPGLIIPELSLEIGNGFLLKCRAQVLYRNVETPETGDPIAKCGLVFLDMNLSDQAELSALLQQAADNRLRVCNRVDMEELWRFFFDSGFIYPSKYLAIEAEKETFKKTYEKLYLESPSIARHFIFQDRGTVFGHMSMLRGYAGTWLIHHHAADRSGHGMAGVAVLDQVVRYINEFHLFHATRMDYVMCYYRKENRFPHRVFGGVAKDLGDPKASSLDAFAYLMLDKPPEPSGETYQVFPAKSEDFADLSRYYESVAGGLALDALNLGPRREGEEELDRAYADNGFYRNRSVFAVKRRGVLLAAVMVTRTELGLNLSNLTNCVHAFVVDEENLLPETLFSAINDICEHYEKMEIPVLVYPASYLDARSVAYDKQYLLWALSMKKSDGFFKALNAIFRRARFGKEQNASENG